jgi:predicted RNase H-like HicB family nuclease/uncharacterized damage-inducible protein DinB
MTGKNPHSLSRQIFIECFRLFFFQEFNMIPYTVYLEINDEGACMAHVMELRGCTVRANSRSEVAQQLSQAVRSHLDWLQQHGEPDPGADAAFEIQISDKTAAFGPFNPGDAAALFPPDLLPATDEDIALTLRLAEYARRDLLTLVQPLPESVLDRLPAGSTFSLRELLRHLGNAEEWYISRLVEHDNLPPEWEHDDALPLFDFLAMERRTAIENLRRLDADQRMGVFYPTQWTPHPEEPWTARKVLRRLVEHELEHTRQVKDILAEFEQVAEG